MLTSSGILFAPPLGRKAWDRQKAPLPKLAECVASLPRKRSCPASATARYPEASGRAPPSRVRPGLALELPPREGGSELRNHERHHTTRTRIRIHLLQMKQLPVCLRPLIGGGRGAPRQTHPAGRLPGAGFANSWRSTGPAIEQLPAPKVPSSLSHFPVNSSRCRPSIADRAVPSAAAPAATAASLATRFSFDVLGRLDFFDFVGRLVFVRLRVFDFAATRLELFFDLTRRFDEVLARFFAFFMTPPFGSI
jgi:hypothetical protein